MIRLYHYSNKDFKGYIDPTFFGANSYTSLSKRISEVKRVYFYTSLNYRERFFRGAKFCYIVEVDNNKIYDNDIDLLNYSGRAIDFSSYARGLIKRGYIGFTSNEFDYRVICLFKAIKIKGRKTLTMV